MSLTWLLVLSPGTIFLGSFFLKERLHQETEVKQAADSKVHEQSKDTPSVERADPRVGSTDNSGTPALYPIDWTILLLPFPSFLLILHGSFVLVCLH